MFAASLIFAALATFLVTTVSSYPTSLNAHDLLTTTTDTRLIAVAGQTDGFNGDWLDDVEQISLSSINGHTHYHNVTGALGQIAGFGSAMLNDTIYIVGGTTPNGSLNSLWAYNVVTNNWTRLSDIPDQPVTNSAVTAANGFVYVISGLYNSLQATNQVFTYEIATDKWSKSAPLLASPSNLGCAVTVSNSVYYIHQYGDIVRSDDGTKTWTKLSSQILGQFTPACAQVGNDGILLAGTTLFGGTQAKVYNITTDTWMNVAPTTVGRSEPAAATIPDSGNALVCGGIGGLKSCEEYDWRTNQWTLLNLTMDNFRAEFGLFVAQFNV